LGSISSSVSDTLNFDCLFEEPATFSSLETKTYLEYGGITVPTELLDKIQHISGGIPGYLSALRKLHLDNIQNIADAIESPSDVEDLLKIQWNASASQITNDDEKILLAVIAYSFIPLDLIAISEIVHANREEARMFLEASGLARQTKDGEWVFYPELLRNIAQNKLKDLKPKAVELLINYYESRKNEYDVNSLLSEYYLITNNFAGIQSLVNPPNIKSILEVGNLGGIRRVLGYAKDLAYQHSNKIGVIHSALLSSQLKSLSNQVIGESEVAALIAIGDFDKALELTYSIKLAPLRIRLLARIYLTQERKGITILRSGLDELKQMVERLEIQDLDPEEVLYTAADLFPILPDESTALIDKIKDQQNAQTALDLIYTLSSLQSLSVSDEGVIGKIENKTLQEMAISRAPWLAKLSPKEVINKVAEVSQTSSKEFILREWCRQNKSDPNLYTVIDAALDAINSDSSYKIPLRKLRQLSDTLRNCNPDQIVRLVNRFDIPNFTSLQSPFE
jgi:hypothetical protein